MHSPNVLSDELRAELERLGEVAAIIAPNAMHGTAVDQFAEAWPNATVFATQGFAERHPELPMDGMLGSEPEEMWADVLDQVVLSGNVFFCEAIFLHRASRTLIVTDLIEFMRTQDLGWWGRAVCRFYGLLDRPAPAPEHQIYALDAQAVRASFDVVRGWDFERIVIAHGPLIESGAPQVFDDVADRVLSVAERRGPLRRGLNRLLAKCH